MLRPDKQKDEHRFDLGWVIALVVIVFVSLGVSRVEAGGVKVQTYNVPKAAHAPTRRIDQGRIRRSTTRDVGGSRFSIDKSRLSKKKSKKKVAKKKTKKKIVKKAAKKPTKKKVVKKSGDKKKIKTLATHTIRPAKSENTASRDLPYDEFNELGTTVFNAASRLGSKVVVTEVPGLTLVTFDKLNTIKENARALETSAAGEAGLLGKDGIDLLPSGESKNPEITTPEGFEGLPGSSETGQGAQQPGKGMTNDEIAEALMNGRFDPGNLGNPGGRSSPSRNRQNNTGSPLTSLLGAIGQKSSSSSAPGSSGPGSWVMDDSGGDVYLVSYTIKSADATGQIMSETFEYSNGNTDTIYYGGDGSIVGHKTEFADGDVIIIDFSSSPQPGCEDMSVPGCENTPIPPAMEGIFVDVEAEYANYKLVAAITREWTGQPSPEQDSEMDVPGIVTRYVSAVRIRPGDCDTRIAGCGENGTTSPVSNQGSSQLQQLGWIINPPRH